MRRAIVATAGTVVGLVALFSYKSLGPPHPAKGAGKRRPERPVLPPRCRLPPSRYQRPAHYRARRRRCRHRYRRPDNHRLLGHRPPPPLRNRHIQARTSSTFTVTSGRRHNAGRQDPERIGAAERRRRRPLANDQFLCRAHPRAGGGGRSGRQHQRRFRGHFHQRRFRSVPAVRSLASREVKANIAGTGVVHQEPVMGTVVTFDVVTAAPAPEVQAGPPARR